jgi:hypothetical protein
MSTLKKLKARGQDKP